jgi:hypothetical protein
MCGGQNRDYWYVDLPDIRDFIKNNLDEVSVCNAHRRFLIRILTTQDRLHPKA